MSPARPAAGDRPAARVPAVPSGVLAMLIFVAAETMFFAGLISAFLIGKASAGGWPPFDQPRLPVAATAVNTGALLMSGVLLVLADRAFATPGGVGRTRGLLAGALALGGLFVGLQGREWVGLLRFGLTLTSSTYGSFFYLIVGLHALHAVAGLVALGAVNLRLRRGALTAETFWTVQVFWYFVVGLWPILYALVYLL